MIPLKPLALGVATGARATIGLAAVARGCAETSPVARAGQPRAALTSEWGRRTTAGALAAELTGDKLPKTPSRLQPQGLAPRFLAGAVCAAALADRDRLPLGPSLLASAAGVALGALGGAGMRSLVKRSGRPDLPFALAEDAVAGALAFGAVRRTPLRAFLPALSLPSVSVPSVPVPGALSHGRHA